MTDQQAQQRIQTLERAIRDVLDGSGCDGIGNRNNDGIADALKADHADRNQIANWGARLRIALTVDT